MPLTAHALASLPIFPLPGVVLFPGALMPLFVFEPRYRELAADVLVGNRLIGMARIAVGHEAKSAGNPPICDVFGVGYVAADFCRPDGCYELLLRGVARAAIDEELPADRAYRRVRSRLIADQTTDAPELARAHARLVRLCERLALSLDEGGDALTEVVRAVSSPSACADALAAAFVRDVDHRQSLLAERDPLARVLQLESHIASLLLQTTPSSGLLN